MLRQGLRVRDGEIDREVEERVGASAPADRRFVCALGGAGAESVLSGRAAERLRAEEQLAGSRVGKGERLYDWALVRWAEHEGWQHNLLVRRSLDAKPEYAFYFTYAPKQKSTLKTLVAVAGRRWAVEIAFQMAKGECGLDHYEVRHWQGWYRHITLAMLALAVLTVLRAGEKKNLPQKGSSQRSRNPASARPVAVARLAKSGTSPALV